MKGKSSINLTSLVEFEHHSMADTIRNENEEKKIKVKVPVTAKKNKQHQTSNCDISITSAAAEIITGERSGLDLQHWLWRYHSLKFGAVYSFSPLLAP